MLCLRVKISVRIGLIHQIQFTPYRKHHSTACSFAFAPQTTFHIHQECRSGTSRRPRSLPAQCFFRPPKTKKTPPGTLPATTPSSIRAPTSTWCLDTSMAALQQHQMEWVGQRGLLSLEPVCQTVLCTLRTRGADTQRSPVESVCFSVPLQPRIQSSGHRRWRTPRPYVMNNCCSETNSRPRTRKCANLHATR